MILYSKSEQFKNIEVWQKARFSCKEEFILISVMLSSTKLWYDCLICSDDLERLDGCHRE